MARELTSSEAGILNVLLEACGCEHVLRAIAGPARDEAMKNGRDGLIAIKTVLEASRCIGKRLMPDPEELAAELTKRTRYDWNVKNASDGYFELQAADDRKTLLSLTWEPDRAPAARCVARCRDNWLPGISSDPAHAARQIAMNVLPAALLMSPAADPGDSSNEAKQD